GRDPEFWFQSVVDLVVPELELDGPPRPTEVVKLHVEGLHDVGRWNARRTRRLAVDHSTCEACPSLVERGLEVVEELAQRMDPRGVEVLRESTLSAPVAKGHRGAALDRALREQLSNDNHRHRQVAA